MTAGQDGLPLLSLSFRMETFRLLIGAYIFGGITILQLNLQAIGVNINIAYYRWHHICNDIGFSGNIDESIRGNRSSRMSR